MLIDLHNHTWPRSHDSVLNPDDLLQRARTAGLDAVCLTEHDTVWEPDSMRELGDRHGFPVFPGIEVSTDDGHMLVFGLDRYVFGMHRIRELARYVEEAKGAMVAAHPYRRQMPWFEKDEEEYRLALERATRNPAYEFVHALETLNGRGSARENRFSELLAELMDTPRTGGTDSHAVQDIGICATYFERDIESLEQLIEGLRAGRFYPVDLRSGTALDPRTMLVGRESSG